MVSLAAPDERLREGDQCGPFQCNRRPSANEFRDRLPLQDVTDEDKRDVPLRLVQQFQ